MSRHLTLHALQRELKLALAQDQGCGGNLTEKEVIANTLPILHALLGGVKEVTVLLCPECNGDGYKTHEECTDYHRRDYTTYYNDCHQCGSTGRIQRTIIKLPDEPYVSLRR